MLLPGRPTLTLTNATCGSIGFKPEGVKTWLGRPTLTLAIATCGSNSSSLNVPQPGVRLLLRTLLDLIDVLSP